MEVGGRGRLPRGDRSKGERDDKIVGNWCTARSRKSMDDKSRMVMDGRIRERRRRANKGWALRVDDFFFSFVAGT